MNTRITSEQDEAAAELITDQLVDDADYYPLPDQKAERERINQELLIWRNS